MRFDHIHVDFPDGRRQVPLLLVLWAHSNYPFAIARHQAECGTRSHRKAHFTLSVAVGAMDEPKVRAR